MCNKSVLCWERTDLLSDLMAVIDHDVSFLINVFIILQHLNQRQKQVFGVTLWSIWKHRNNKVWNNIINWTQSICERVGSLLTNWTNAQTICNNASRQSNIQGVPHWRKPSPNRYKCNVDVSFSHALNRVGLGTCIRDEEGRFVLAKTEWLTPLLDMH